jgi:hypothetical protein
VVQDMGRAAGLQCKGERGAERREGRTKGTCYMMIGGSLSGGCGDAVHVEGRAAKMWYKWYMMMGGSPPEGGGDAVQVAGRAAEMRYK